MSRSIGGLERSRGFSLLLFSAVIGLTAASWAAEVPRQVLAFYYPWYGTADGPGGAGETRHWRRIDTVNKDIAAATDYPQLGAYDSHDPNLIDQHCRWAKAAGIDGLIVSWWGQNDYTDRAMPLILDACKRHGLTACIYYETVPRPQTPESAAKDIVKALNKYGRHPAYMKINGKPVVFIYGRAVQQLGLAEWLKALKMVNAEYEGGIVAIGDQFSYGAARVFDGVHTYNTAGQLRGRDPSDVGRWAAETYPSWVQLADAAGKISAITVIPGYDDRKIRKPGLAVKRYDGELYRVQWEQAIKADPHWVLITSFNEWHEGSEIEPSLQYGRRYLDLTAEYAARFKANRNRHRPAGESRSAGALSQQEKQRLRNKLKGVTIAVLPGADSMGFWWLLDMGIKTELLSWDKVVAGDLTPQRYPLLLYCAGERYRRTVHSSGDVDEALAGYLRSGGFLAVLPALPWPFYYDEDGHAVNRSGQFGVTLRMSWKRPPEGLEARFFQPKHYLQHVPEQFAFPTSGDLRWRPFFAQAGADHISLLQLRDAAGNSLGDGIAYAKLKDGGKVLYVCFNLLEGPHAEGLLYDVFDFISTRLDR
jgi:glycoprotein endo-alpha-1,2-mannosidase